MSNGPLVAFSITRSPRELPSSVRLLVVPSQSTWNDFTFKVASAVGVRKIADQPFEWTGGYIAFRGEHDSRKFLEDLFIDRKVSFLSSHDVPVPFATLLQTLKSYQLLTRTTGTATAQRIATEAQDVAHLRLSGTAPSKWDDFTLSDPFTLAFMRSSDAVFAYQHGGAILAGRTLDVEDSRQSFDAQVRFGKRVLDYRFQFEGGILSDNRIAVLIGRNGAGKTASLISIGKSLLGARKRGIRLSRTPSFNQILIFAHSSTIARFKIDKSHPRAAAQLVFSLDSKRPVSSSSSLTSLFARIARESERKDGPLDNLHQVFKTEFHGVSALIPVHASNDSSTLSLNRRTYLPLESFSRGGEQLRLARLGRIDEKRRILFVGADAKPRNLSLGQDVFVSFVFRAIAEAGQASAILIDELENFLHPNLISKFVRMLHAVLARTKSIAIVATHSPYVVREVNRSQVQVLRWDAEREGVVVQRPRMQTFGASISEISDFIFDDDLPKHLYIELMRRYPHATVPPEELIASLRNEVSLDALMRLRSLSAQGAEADEPDPLL